MDYDKELSARLAEIHPIASHELRAQLLKFYRNCEHTRTELSKESVECRRRRLVTPKYKELEQKFLENLNTFDQWCIMAKLLD